jgi:hypothetical protein
VKDAAKSGRGLQKRVQSAERIGGVRLLGSFDRDGQGNIKLRDWKALSQIRDLLREVAVCSVSAL